MTVKLVLLGEIATVEFEFVADVVEVLTDVVAVDVRFEFKFVADVVEVLTDVVAVDARFEFKFVASVVEVLTDVVAVDVRSHRSELSQHFAGQEEKQFSSSKPIR